jgi:O-antigen biosynthesis rhamnosyltransferase
MRVLHVYKCALPESMGGVEQVIHQIASGASQRGVQTDVLTLSHSADAEPLSYAGYTVHRAKCDVEVASTRFSISAFWKFFKLAKRADIIHYHFPWPVMDVMQLLLWPRKPSVLTYHSDIVRQKKLLKIYWPLLNWMLSSVTRVVASSPNYLVSSEVLSKYKSKVEVITYGLDIKSYPSPSQDRCAEWEAKVGSKFFLFVGVLRYYKGLHILLDAVRGAPYSVVIVGAGPVEQELKKQAQALGVTNVHFFGFLPDDDKVALLRLCFGVVFPSHLRSEAFGISLLEGAMFGKPMISSEIGTGTTFINVANQTGLVVPPSDPLALRAAMDHLWANPDEAAEMGRRAEERYWQLFTAEQMVDAYVGLYERLLNGRSVVAD